MSPLERFLVHVEKTEECWKWRGFISPNGYGNFWIDGRYDKAHRAAYRLLIGPIPTNREIDHLCRNKSCVKPDHLELVTRAENMRRGNKARWEKERLHAG